MEGPVSRDPLTEALRTSMLPTHVGHEIWPASASELHNYHAAHALILLTADMSHLLVLVFVIEAVVHTVNAVGAAAINDLVRSFFPSLCAGCIANDLRAKQIWTAVNLLPIATSEEAKKKKKLFRF